LRANLRKKAKADQTQQSVEKPLVNSPMFTSKYHNHIKETKLPIAAPRCWQDTEAGKWRGC